MTANIYNRPCEPDMAKMRENEYSLSICDPPYGIGIDGQKESINTKNPKANRKAHKFKGWDNSIPSFNYFNTLWHISKNQIIWGANYFVNYLKPSKGWIIWYKGQEGLTMSDAELAYSSFDISTRVVKINRIELLKDKTVHPTQKPIKLYKWLLKNYAKEGDKIIDTHGGSMSIVIACIEMGFDIDVWEIDKDYFQDAKKRIQNHVKQLNLFQEQPIINFYE